VGNTIEIEYLPDSPGRTAVNRSRELSQDDIVVAVLGAALGFSFLGDAFYTIYKAKRTAPKLDRLRTDGILLFGTLTDFEKPIYVIPSNNVGTIFYEFATPDGEQIHAATRAKFRWRREKLQPGQTMAILYVDDALYKPL
jgi:hypothetical protein